MARRGATERRGSALMGQIIALVVLIPLAILVVSWVLQSGGPFKSNTQVDSNLPVVLRTIRSANQLVTAQTEVDVPITGKSSSMLPGSDEKIIYYAVYNVTAGVDLSKMKDADITESNGTITIVLPAPEILSQIARYDQEPRAQPRNRDYICNRRHRSNIDGSNSGDSKRKSQDRVA